MITEMTADGKKVDNAKKRQVSEQCSCACARQKVDGCNYGV